MTNWTNPTGSTTVTADDLAWRLADLLPAALPDMDRHAIYVALGCRHFRSAIALSLRALIEQRLRLSDVVIDDLRTWLAALHEDRERGSLEALLQTVIHREAARTIPPLGPGRRPQLGTSHVGARAARRADR
ncbi:hypothetical protein QN239_17385 [Mycolicibacterium sp. Y3]